MGKPKKNHQIIFIYRDKLVFCNSNQNESVEFPLSNEVVKDLGIIDEIRLEKQLREFLGESRDNFEETLIILNKNTYFRTTIENPELNPSKNKDKIDEFSDLVPFNNIFVKQFSIKKKLEIVAINREFYEPILEVFHKLDFNITMILPELVVQDSITESGCTPEENIALLKTIGKFKSYDLLGSKHKLVTKNNSDIEPIKKQNKRLMALVITFGFLILILVGAIIFNANRTYEDDVSDFALIDKVVTSTNEDNKATASAKIIEDKEEISTSSAVLDLDQYKIRVLNGSGISGQAGIVSADLQKAGFENIDIGNAKKISSNKTQVLLISTLPTEIKTLVLDIVKNIGQEYTVQESSELNYDIVITTTAAE